LNEKNLLLKDYGLFQEGRDPCGHVVTIAYFVIINDDMVNTIQAGDDAANAEWFTLGNLPRKRN